MFIFARLNVTKEMRGMNLVSHSIICLKSILKTLWHSKLVARKITLLGLFYVGGGKPCWLALNVALSCECKVVW